MAQQSGILQVVNGTGEFNEDGLNAFIRRHGIQDIGVGYQIVAITGPQSSGKSTLMNALVRCCSPRKYSPNCQ
jgi:ABC-type phosphate/phosphonate transport system ATPase subunit